MGLIYNFLLPTKAEGTNMLKDLKKLSLKKTITQAIFWLAIGSIALCFAWFSGLHYLTKGPVNLNEMADENIKEGYVQGQIYAIMDYYEYTTNEDDDTIEKQYFIPVGEKSYIGLVANREYMSACDKLMKESQDYLEGTREQIDSIFHVTGTILPMNSESFKFYQDYYTELGVAENGEEIFLPYYLKIDYVGKFHKDFYYVLGIVAGLSLVIAIWLVVTNAMGRNQEMVTDYCKKAADYEHAMRLLEEFYYSTTPVWGIRVSPKFFMAPKGRIVLLLETGEILWAYQSTTTHRTNGIKTGTTYDIILRLKNGLQYKIPVKNDAAAQEVLQYIADAVPYIVIGYDDQIEQLYYENRQEMINEQERRKQEYSVVNYDSANMMG